ncbi:hypothetical protein E2A64_08090 [Pseudohoeflea suaedae]|uniref:Phosphodiester glycosidase domain-containing protein n=1 Tax=Pseudohoeflea suaedae TaxID=877384 RepID=A0A4R5PPL6_9HYPH|nr:phosphodiester glycosidase family protein [Pseudohoeflea suaedae]TDH39032.1 hypothetical protein E2A64_08090 [Pseudohoeflea suaedae]
MNRYLLLLISVLATLVVAAILWWALTSRTTVEPAQGVEGNEVEALTHGCRKTQVDGIRYVVCEIDPATADLELFHAGPDGKPWGDVEGFVAASKAEGRAPLIAMNAGMYHSDLSPVGLLVEGGEQIAPVNTSGGFGNFFLKPNGIFYVDETGKPGVMETEAYVTAGIRPRIASQSGPMMVIDGQLHPRFLVAGTSTYTRNGIGVTPEGKVVMALSLDPVNFYGFAMAFKNAFDCPNALFFDGSVSALYADGTVYAEKREPAGTVIAVME